VSDQTINTGVDTIITLPGCTDPEGAVCFVLEESTPYGGFDSATMTYTFFPESGNEGTYTVRFSISDGSVSNPYSFKLTVQTLATPTPIN
jgi:hypothetical protein